MYLAQLSGQEASGARASATPPRRLVGRRGPGASTRKQHGVWRARSDSARASRLPAPRTPHAAPAGRIGGNPVLAARTGSACGRGRHVAVEGGAHDGGGGRRRRPRRRAEHRHEPVQPGDARQAAEPTGTAAAAARRARGARSCATPVMLRPRPQRAAGSPLLGRGAPGAPAQILCPLR